jgi:hypothetical protein
MKYISEFGDKVTENVLRIHELIVVKVFALSGVDCNAAIAALRSVRRVIVNNKLAE